MPPRGGPALAAAVVVLLAAVRSAAAVDVDTILRAHLANTTNVLHPPAYSPGGKPVNVSVQVNVISLTRVDELSSTAVFTIFHRTSWTDPRLDVPELFEGNSVLQAEGVSLLGLQDDPDTYPVWVPDTYFTNAVDRIDEGELSETGRLLNLFPGGFLFFSRFEAWSFLQERLDLREFPEDTQDFEFNVGSYGYSTNMLRLQPLELGTANLEENPLWEFTGRTKFDLRTDFFFGSGQRLGYDVVQYRIQFARRSESYIIQHIIPVTVLMFFVSAIFWLRDNGSADRLHLSVTLLLTLAALTFVVTEGIPKVDYTTKTTEFVLFGFFLLFGSSCLHIVIMRVRPTSPGTAYVLEYFGRAVFPPSILIFFAVLFSTDAAFLAPASVLMVLYVVGTCFAAYRRYMHKMADLAKLKGAKEVEMARARAGGGKASECSERVGDTPHSRDSLYGVNAQDSLFGIKLAFTAEPPGPRPNKAQSETPREVVWRQTQQRSASERPRDSTLDGAGELSAMSRVSEDNKDREETDET